MGRLMMTDWLEFSSLLWRTMSVKTGEGQRRERMWSVRVTGALEPDHEIAPGCRGEQWTVAFSSERSIRGRFAIYASIATNSGTL
jgi:hypothetical protein